MKTITLGTVAAFFSLLNFIGLGNNPSSQLAAISGAGSGLVAYYNFDEGSGTTANDSSGNNYNGTLTNGPTWTASGKIGGAVNLDGVDDYINRNALSTLNSGDMSICLWANPTTISGAKWFAEQWDTGGAGPALFTNGANIIFEIGNYNNKLITSNSPLKANTWQHICATAAGSNFTIFYNGAQIASGTGARTESISSSFGIGGPNNLGGVSTFSGTLDDLRIYNRALSASEVSDLYTYTGSVSTPTPVNGVCGSRNNVCTSGVLSDTTDTSSNYLWSCTGSNGGTTATCSLPIPVTPPSDTTPPTISSISASSITSSSATITFTTNESSDTQVEYGLSTSYGNTTTLNSTLTTSHSQTLSGLTPSTTYHYRVKSKDASNNLSTSNDFTFGTGAAAPLTTYYVTPTGAGSKNGSDWNNAYAGLPTSPTRGSTYYLAGGTYGAYMTDQDDSGSATITIKKAIASDHGTDTGYQSTYSTSAAVFNGSIALRKSHFILDGQTGGGPGSWTTGFGIQVFVTNKVNTATGIDIVDRYQPTTDYRAPSYVTVKHFEVIGDGGDGQGGYPENDAVTIGNSANGNIDIAYSYVHDMGGAPFFILGADPTIVEDTYVGNFESYTTEHAEIASTGGNGLTFRNNIFADVEGTGGLMFNGSNFYVYGNVFYRAPGATFTWGGGNGLIGAKSNGDALNNVNVHNNTFYDAGGSVYGFYMTPSQTFASNNLYYLNSSLGVTPTGSNNITSSVPGLFTNPTGLDFTLTSNTVAGTNLGSPYNIDPLGHTRTTWTAGAYEYTGSVSTPTPDTTLPTVSISSPSNNSSVSGSSVSISASASDNIGVIGVQFKLDGNNLGQELTTAPYSGTWDTTGVSNGTHTLTAIARDQAGNTKTSSSITVTVSNTIVTPTNGVCGTTQNICTTGTLQDVTDSSSNYLWNCLGLNSGTTATCSLTKPVTPPTPTNGVCGTTQNICTTGTFLDQTDSSSNYLWSCTGSNGGTTATCSLPIPITVTTTPPTGTFTPTVPQRPPSGGGGGGGSGATHTTTTTLSSSSSQLSQLVELLISLGVIAPNKVQVARSFISSQSSTTSSPTTNTKFTLALDIGARNSEVTTLQTYLISQGLLTSSATGYYGPLTAKAVGKFQELYSISTPSSPSYGFVGPKTRAKLNEVVR